MSCSFLNARRRAGCVAGCAAGAVLMLFSSFLSAQQSSPTDVQREAMHKLAFLAGHWSGPVTITHGPGAPIRLTQSEDVQYKLDGLVLLIEGESTGPDGKAQFKALATVAFDEATHMYRIRAYSDGHYVDAELKLLQDGFSWSFPAGPAQITNTMHLTQKGEWQETTEVSVGNTPPHKSVEMLLQHQP